MSACFETEVSAFETGENPCPVEGDIKVTRESYRSIVVEMLEDGRLSFQPLCIKYSDRALPWSACTLLHKLGKLHSLVKQLVTSKHLPSLTVTGLKELVTLTVLSTKLL